MVVQNNPTPWVVLALLILAGCVITGMLLGNVGPFNSRVAEAKIPVQQTQGALDSLATQSAMELSQTQQAPMVLQTAVVAQMTTAPLQQAATQVAISNAFQAIQANATETAIAGEVQNTQLMAQANQTAIANGLYMQNLSSNATATSIARSQVLEQSTGIASFSIIIIGVLVICGWIITRAIAQIITAYAREKVAQAQLLSEQRRLASLRQSIQAQRNSLRQQYPLPMSLIKKSNGGKELPRAE